MDFTDHYIFINEVNAIPNAMGTEVVVPLKLGTARGPHALFEVVSATYSDEDYANGVIVKADLSASNYYGVDNSGTCIAVLGLDVSDLATPVYYYKLSGSAPKLLGSSSLQRMTLRITNLSGVPLDFATAAYAMVIKVSYPVKGETGQLFSSQVR